jgi:Tat protein translocase TatB subunit
MLPNVGAQELLIIFIIALVVVGPKRLPEIGRTLGRGLNEFRKLQDEVRDMVKFDLNDDPPASTPHMELAAEAEASDPFEDEDVDESEDETDDDPGPSEAPPSHPVFDLAAAEDPVVSLPPAPSDPASDASLPPAASAE